MEWSLSWALQAAAFKAKPLLPQCTPSAFNKPQTPAELQRPITTAGYYCPGRVKAQGLKRRAPTTHRRRPLAHNSALS